jgi:hypothetical protein
MTLEQSQLLPCTSSEQYLELFRDCFPETIGTPLLTKAHYDWKYGRNGKDRPVFEFAAFEEGRMVGYYAALPFRYGSPAGNLLGGMVCDVMTHSSMRGRGMFTKQGHFSTAAMAEAGVDFVLGFPIRKFVIPGHLKVGWSIAFGLPVYFKLLDPKAPLATRGCGWLASLLRPVSNSYLALRKIGRDDAGEAKEISAELLGSEEHREFLHAWERQHPFHLNRTTDFFSWRLTAPGSEYHILEFRHGGKVAGIAVTRMTKLQGFDVLAVVDLLLLQEFGHAAGTLHEFMARIARKLKASAVVIMLPAPEARSLRLARNGFFRSPVEFKLILKWLSQKPVPDRFWDASAWHLMWADTDNL